MARKNEDEFLNELADMHFRAGLEEAKRRLGIAGLHDGRCPEPDESCNCGLDAAIDTDFGPIDPASDNPYQLPEGTPYWGSLGPAH